MYIGGVYNIPYIVINPMKITEYDNICYYLKLQDFIFYCSTLENYAKVMLIKDKLGDQVKCKKIIYTGDL